MTKNLFRILLFLLLPLAGQAKDADSLRVLWVGNSYTYYNDMPAIVQQIAATQKVKVSCTRFLKGGERFSGHLTNQKLLKALAALAHEIWNEYFPCILEQGQIDYMVEKFQSHEAISRQISEEGYRYFLLREEGDTAGYAGICPRDGKLFLSKLYLRRQFRGRSLTGCQ